MHKKSQNNVERNTGGILTLLNIVTYYKAVLIKM